MGLRKKKNVIIISTVFAVSFILYQLYFFFTLTSDAAKRVQMLDFNSAQHHTHVKSKEDIYINDNGVIRGVLFSTMPRFRPDSNNEFKCLKSNQKIPFDRVNDDYCDCDDTTDEPSTNACSDGIFYCDTQYRSKPATLNIIPSSKVNDGICDCCDGSDEWLHSKVLTQGSMKLKRHIANKCLNICNS